MQRISNSLFEAINKVTSGQALNEATDGEKKPVKKGEGHKPAWLLAAEIRAEKKEGKLKEASGGTGMKECKPKQATADRKQQKADTKQQARDAFDGMFGGGNPADKLKMKKEDVHMKENMEMPEAPEPEDKIEAPSLNDKIKAIAMKKAAQTDNGNSVQALSARGPGADVKEEIENEDESFELSEATRNTEKRHIDSIIKMKEVKKSKHDMAPSIHDNMEDALENGDHKKIDQLHKVFKHITEEVEAIDETTRNTEKRHINSLIKMKELEKAGKKNTKMGRMADVLHMHTQDAFEEGNHKKIDKIHTFYHGMVDANKKDKAPEHDILKGSKHVFKEETITEKEKWIAGAIKKPGAETASAKKAGMTNHAYAEKHKHDSGKAGKRARLALTLEKLPRHHGKRNKVDEAAFDSHMDEGVTETIVKHNDFVIEVTDNPTYGDFLRAIRSISDPDLVSEAEAISLASDAYDVGYDEIIVEDFTRSEIMDKHAAHRKAGNTVSHEKFGSRDGKPYAEYVVTDKEGGRKKYIHHGTTRRMESMSGKHKNAE
jgi:hypothetical protein